MKSNVALTCLVYLLALRRRSSTAAFAGDTFNDNDRDPAAYRLPDTTEPVSYALRMKPVIDPANNNYTFGGQVDVIIRAKRQTTEVVLNSRDLTVTAVLAFQDMKTKRHIPVNGHVIDEPGERLIIRLGKKVMPPRLYKFTVEFDGALRNDLTGFHKYFYDSDDRSRYL